MRKIVLAIDFNNVVFASYYGQKLINSRGMNVNAIKGFFFKIKTLKDMFNPDYIVFGSDLSRELTFRRKLYKSYKAQRKPHDPDIITQMKYIQNITSLLGYPMINNERYEADDILGMISRFAEERDMDTIIISSDRDLYQLVTDHTFILSPRNNDLIDKAWMMEHYKLTPEQWTDLKILQGDRSDNIPGIYGVGEVTALKLMQQYGSIDGIYANLQHIQEKLRELLIIGKDMIPLTRKLVTIVTDYTKIGLTEDQLQRKEKYMDEVFGVLQDLEIYSLFNVVRYSLWYDKEMEVVDYDESKDNS